MSKTLLHRLFGLGKIPKRYAPTLHDEGIVLIDEGIGGPMRRPPNNVLEPTRLSRLEAESCKVLADCHEQKGSLQTRLAAQHNRWPEGGMRLS